MTKHDIRFRREAFSQGHIKRHKNYQSLIKRHRRQHRLRNLLWVLLFVVLVILTLLFLEYGTLQWQEAQPNQPPVEMPESNSPAPQE